MVGTTILPASLFPAFVSLSHFFRTGIRIFNIVGIGKAVNMVEPNGKFHKTKYSLDGIEEGDATDDVYSRANPARPGFTKSDQKDMWRMGKIQELKVRSSQLTSSPNLELQRAVVRTREPY